MYYYTPSDHSVYQQFQEYENAISLNIFSSMPLFLGFISFIEIYEIYIYEGYNFKVLIVNSH